MRLLKRIFHKKMLSSRHYQLLGCCLLTAGFLSSCIDIKLHSPWSWLPFTSYPPTNEQFQMNITEKDELSRKSQRITGQNDNKISSNTIFNDDKLTSYNLTNDYEATFDGVKYRNDTPAPVFLVPNIVHYIRWNLSEYSFVDYVCFRSAYVNHRPSNFFIHTNTNFSGKWWDRIMAEPDWARRIEIFWSEPPSQVWGQELSKEWRHYHGSDVYRIQTLLKYGGIYLDNDVYVIQNLDRFRRYEMTLAWDEGKYLGTQVLIANKNARFLVEWLETYKEYYPESWYYNAGDRPTIEVLSKRPSLVHRVQLKFGVHLSLPNDLYNKYWPGWRSYYTVHLLIKHKHLHNKKFMKKYGSYDEKNILSYRMTFGEMVREVMPTDLLT